MTNRCVYLGWLALAIVPAAYAQGFPAKSIRILCATPGASGDFSARLIAHSLSAGFGQSVIVYNQ